MTAEKVVRATLDEAIRLEAMLFRHLIEGLEDGLLPDQADEVIDHGLREYGRWRGRRARSAHLTSGVYLSARDLLARWPDAEFVAPLAFGLGTADGSTSHAALRTRWLPHVGYWVGAGRRDLAERYYATVIPEYFAGYHPDIECTVRLGDDATTVDVEVRFRSLPADGDRHPVTTEILDHPAATRAMIRRQVQNRSALYALLGRAALDAYDATGEVCLRDGLRRYGRERGDGQRERDVHAGLRPTLKTLMTNFDVPVEDAWEWRDEGYLSDGVWFQDCTFCPHIPVWKELDALDLGQIYDVEVHVAQFGAYHPGIQVQWDRLQTRGDAECRFRFVLPAERTDDDPEFQRTPYI